MTRARPARLRGVLVALLVALAAVGFQVPPFHDGVARAAPRDGAGSLVVVLDLSGSMADDDGTGTIKIEGAKAALSELLRNARTGSEVGIWGYPGRSGGDCDPGDYIPGGQLRAVADRSRLVDAVRELEPYGGTPTGAALRAVAASLRADQREHATVLLVSDGESNCDEPPCEVAEEIAASGVDLTVNTVGFQISDTGREELECIARATRGAYFAIDDARGLEEKLPTLANSRLTVEVEAESQVVAGGAVTITARVRNDSALDVADAKVGLVIEGHDARAIFPAVLPPRYSLGNVPAGTSVTRTWHLSTFGGGAGAVSWVVSARGTDSLPGSASGSVRVIEAAPSIDQAGSLLTDALANGPLVIMGDSYSSGEGAGPYLAASSGIPEECHRSTSTHGMQLLAHEDDGLVVACSGAVIHDLMAPGGSHGTERSQLELVATQSRAPGAVLMSIGGNDIGFSGVVTRCVLLRDCTAGGELEEVERAIDDQRWALEAAYRAVAATANSERFMQARGGRSAPLLVLSYPQVLPSAWRGICGPSYDATSDAGKAFIANAMTHGLAGMAVYLASGPFSTKETLMANEIVAHLNATIAAAVATVRAEGYDVHHVDTVHQAVLPSHTACDADPYINPVRSVGDAVLTAIGGSTSELMHPDADGHRAIAGAILTWSQSASLDLESSAPPATEVPVVTASEPVTTVTFTADATGTVTLRRGDAVEVVVENVLPGSSVMVTLRSDPVVLGNVVADADGRASRVLYVPGAIPAGEHTLVATGLDPELRALTLVQPVRVLPARPWWVVPLGIASGVLVLGGVVLAVAYRAGRRGRQPWDDAASSTSPSAP